MIHKLCSHDLYIMYYHAARAECGGIFSGVNGTISSPNYPSPYPTYTYCKYQITVPYGSACIEFLAFGMNTCCDSVSIYEGDTITNRIGR